MAKLFIHTEIDETHLALPTKELVGLRVPSHVDVDLQEVTPESHWEETNRLFFSLDDDRLVLAVGCTIHNFNAKIQAVVIVDIGTTVPNCRIFNVDDYKSQALSIFRHKRLGHDITWIDIWNDYPELLDCTDSIVVEADGERMTVRTSIKRGLFTSVSQDEIYALTFAFECHALEDLGSDVDGHFGSHSGDEGEDDIYYEQSRTSMQQLNGRRYEFGPLPFASKI